MIPLVLMLALAFPFVAEPTARAAEPGGRVQSEPDRAAGCATPEHRQFDFWIGDWNVHTADGRLAGTNRIEPILDGCALQERWTGARGMRGRSLNMYSAADGRWHQTWIDTNGLRLELAGSFRDGRMVLSGEVVDPKRGTVRHRITWEPLDEGRVRQHWEQSADGGRTWTDLFVGTYTRRSPG